MSRNISRIYARWGKGMHPAGLNFGDCFAYALAEERGYPLLRIGDDFARPAFPPSPDAANGPSPAPLSFGGTRR